MNHQLYEAAQTGDCDVIQQYACLLDSQLTPNKNTVLHVLAQFCDSSFAVQKILAINHSLLHKWNAENETALHIAASNRHSNVVRELINCTKDCEKQSKICPEAGKRMLRKSNKKGDTTLHVAVRKNCHEIVDLLVKEDPQFVHPRNGPGETPLYLATESGYHRIANLILATCNSPSYHGPSKRTALHAATIRNSEECMKLILEKLPNLVKEVDSRGWTALHLAARLNNQKCARLLLLTDKSMAYEYVWSNDSNDKRTALHIAAIHGHLDVIKELLQHCPDCWEMVTGNDQNILHLAVENEQKQVLDFILQNFWASQLINQEDYWGHTPLHLYATTKSLIGYNLLNHHNADKNAFDKAGSTPLDVTILTPQTTQRKDVIKSELERSGAAPGFRRIHPGLHIRPEQRSWKKEVINYLIAGMLLVTISLAAGFIIQGGYIAVLKIVLVIFEHLVAFLLLNLIPASALTNIRDATLGLLSAEIFHSTTIRALLVLVVLVAELLFILFMWNTQLPEGF